VRFGEFPHITNLNPAFRPGMRRIKLTLRIGAARRGAREILDQLAGFLPTLSFHRCCGGNLVRQTFFRRSERRHCAIRRTDDGVDLAHLVEHVVIDVQHYVARMKICSGVTCAHADPPDLYDVFVESPEAILGRACAGIAVDLVQDLLASRRADPAYLCMMQVARLARDSAGWPVHPRLGPLLSLWGERNVLQAVESLKDRGFLEESAACFNFSGRPLLAYVPGFGAPALSP